MLCILFLFFYYCECTFLNLKSLFIYLFIIACSPTQLAMADTSVESPVLDQTESTKDAEEKPVDPRNRFGFPFVVPPMAGKREYKYEEDAWSYAAMEPDVQHIRRLHRAGTDINHADYNGRTGVHWAAIWRRIETLRYLIDNGADVNAKEKRGLLMAPIHMAAQRHYVDVIEILLAAGAEKNVVDRKEVTPYALAEMSRVIPPRTEEDKRKTLELLRLD